LGSFRLLAAESFTERPMHVRRFRDTDLIAVAKVFGRGPALLPRDPHIMDRKVYPHAAAQLLEKSGQQGGLCPEGISVAESNGRVTGVLSAAPGKGAERGEVRWLAVESGADFFETVERLLARGMEFLRSAGCQAAQIKGWMDQPQKPLAAVLEDLEFRNADTDQSYTLMVGTLDSLPAPPELPDGCRAHTYRPGDEERWLQVRNQSFGSDASLVAFEANYSGRSTFDPHELVFVECGEEPVAVSAGVHHRYEIEGQPFGVAYLDNVAVVPEHQGRGLGKFVCLSCMDYLKRHGNRRCSLVTQPFRVPAVGLYEKLGFKRIGCNSTYLRDL